MEILGLFNIPLSLILLVGAVVLLYIFGTWNQDYFRKQGIPGPKPYPFFGNNTDIGFMHRFHGWKQKYGKIFGIFMGREPVLVVSDLDILKEVFVKSFDNFRNRRRLFLVGSPLSLAVFFLEDAAWKRVRNIITPTFSSGKLRAMCPAINDCAKTLIRNFTRTFSRKESVNMKEYFGAYTMDVIASTAFGVKVDSQNNFDDPFITHAKQIFAPNQARRPLLLIAGWFPLLARLFRALQVSFFSNDVNTFFVKQLLEIIKQREQECKEVSQKRTDFLQLLMDAEVPDNNNERTETSNGHATNGHLPNQESVRRLTRDEIVGQGILFFVAGYETTASTLNFASFALANNPNVQEKAFQEIKEKLGDEDPDYDNIGQLKYLENVVIETLRLFPPVVALNRRATETITIKGLTIPEGSTVFIPALSIQRDPQLYKDPEAFRPERHDEKNNPISFLTFGYGPRICIGMRLALIEAKIALVHVLRQVKFERAPDTPVKMTFKDVNILQPKEPNMLTVTSRN